MLRALELEYPFVDDLPQSVGWTSVFRHELPPNIVLSRRIRSFLARAVILPAGPSPGQHRAGLEKRGLLL
jgi:hypothetical protein